MVNKSPVRLDIEQMPFLKILLGYLTGVMLGQWISWSPTLLTVAMWWVVALTVLLGLAFWFSMPAKLLTGLLYTCWILIGLWQYGRVVPESSAIFFGDRPFMQLIGRVSEEPLHKEKSIRFRVDLQAGLDSLGESHHVSGRLLLTVYRDRDSLLQVADSSVRPIRYGDRIQFEARPVRVSPPLNPHEFDYQSYLANRGIYHQQRVQPDQVIVISSHVDWYGYVLLLKDHVVRRFRENITDQHAFSVAAALVFGYRAELDPEVYAAFTNTGTIHILSVSGMHVSMVFMLLTFLLRPLDRWSYGRSTRFLVVFVFIWGYVVLTGMAPPILRAGIMISFFLLSQWMGRRQLGLNALFASGFFILLYDPRMLFEIGFQLSYLAMIGIFSLFPMLRGLYLPKNRWARMAVEYSWLSIAAQLITTPLTLFYFGQFPNYFLLANLLVTLPATIIMYLGIALMVFPVPILSPILGRLEDMTVNGLVGSLQWISQLPGSTWQGIHVNPWEVVLMFVGIAALFVAMNYRNKLALYSSLILCILLAVGFWAKQLRRQQYRGIHIYQMRQQVALASFENGWITLFTTLDSISHPSIQYSVMPDLIYYRSSEQIRLVHIPSDHHVMLKVGNKVIFVQHGTYQGKDIAADLVLLRKNPVLRQDDVPADAVGRYILDGSNWGYRLRENEQWLNRHNQPYYTLKDNFAYVWETR